MTPDRVPAGRRIEPFFLPCTGGNRFCLFHPAVEAARSGAIVYVHPFAEEMNKSRRMAALQASALSAIGFSVLAMDLYGCGDSDGEFGDATWQQWIADVVVAAGWLQQRSGLAPSLWGLRAGCLLAREAARSLPSVPNLLFWQPVVSGNQHLRQFLRLRVAQQLSAGDNDARIGTKELHEQLAAGETIDVAGYALAPGLALGLDASELAPLRQATRVAWMEVSSAEQPEVSPAGKLKMQAWQAAGHAVAEYAVSGPSFWQTQEIEECIALVEATRTAVQDWHR